MKKALVCIVVIIAGTVITNAEYGDDQLFVISWGNGPSQLKLGLPVHNFNPIDSTDDVDPGSGPNKAFIDSKGNLIVASSDFRQLKGFDMTGNLLFDVSAEVAPNFSIACQGSPIDIFVDSSSNIYIISFEPMSYIAPINYTGVIISKLDPFSDTINSNIGMMKWSPDGHIFFREQEKGWITYYKGEFIKNGCRGQLASNGYFYAAYTNPDYPHILFIGKYNDVDTLEHPEYSYVKSIELPGCDGDTLYYAEEMAGGDGNSIYIFASTDSCDISYGLIWQYDLEFNLIDELRLPYIEGPDYVSPSPVVGPDGSIYEFRAFDDGLHVIRWTKQ